MTDFIGGLVLLFLILFLVAVLYKYRVKIKRWITDEKYSLDWRPDPVTRAERKVKEAEWELQDAQIFLAHRRSQEDEEKAIEPD